MTGVYDEAELYCAAFDFPVNAEVDWLLEQVGPVTRVLEPMCGNARYGIEFVKRGIDYLGFDRSPFMLARTQAIAGMTLLQADATDFAIKGNPCDLAFCPIDSIRHLSADEAIPKHLSCVWRHLRDRGMYVIEVDLMSRDGDQPRAPDSKSKWSMKQPDGTMVEAVVYGERFDLANRRMWERSIYRRVRDGEVIAEANELHEMRQVTWSDLAAAAGDAGFTIDAVHAHLSGNRRPRVEPGSHLENTGTNHYVFLRR